MSDFLSKYFFIISFITLLSCSSENQEIKLEEREWKHLNISEYNISLDFPDGNYRRDTSEITAVGEELTLSTLRWEKGNDRLILVKTEIPKDWFNYDCKVMAEWFQHHVISALTMNEINLSGLKNISEFDEFSHMVLYSDNDTSQIKTPIIESYMVDNQLYIAFAMSKSPALRRRFLSSICVQNMPNALEYYSDFCGLEEERIKAFKRGDCGFRILTNQQLFHVGDIYEGVASLASDPLSRQPCKNSQKFDVLELTIIYRNLKIPTRIENGVGYFNFKVKEGMDKTKEEINDQYFSCQLKMRTPYGDSTIFMKQGFGVIQTE